MNGAIATILSFAWKVGSKGRNMREKLSLIKEIPMTTAK
jgi:hypothetical protein